MVDSEQILISILSSGITTVILFLLLMRFFERYIDHQFHKKDATNDALIDIAKKYYENIFEKEFLIYPDIIEVIYRCRNAAREITNNQTNRKVIDEFNISKIHLTENLYKYRIFISEDIFRKIHRFKIEIQEFGVLLDMITRSDEVEDAPVDPKLREITKIQLNEKYEIINRYFESINADIKKYMDKKAKIKP